MVFDKFYGKKMKDKLYDKKEKKTILIIFQNQEKKYQTK